jgi:hypothetical protein
MQILTYRYFGKALSWHMTKRLSQFISDKKLSKISVTGCVMEMAHPTNVQWPHLSPGLVAII